MIRSIPRHWAGLSMRSRLLLGILGPVLALVALNALGVYRQALRSADIAYDRTLLASAKAIGEQLDVAPGDTGPQVRAAVPYSALEAFEADNRSRMFYRVTGFQGEMVSGFADLPAWRGRLPDRGIYAALVDFYDGRYHDEPVRVAVLLQPVSGLAGQGMATIQVAETLELRQALARQILLDTLWRQAALLAVIALVVVAVVQQATRPVRRLSDQLDARAGDDLTPLQVDDAPPELKPLVEATNHVMARLSALLSHQKRFVRDTAHQLRTPLAVLKAQVQSGQRGDVDPATALSEINTTVDQATALANQMLALAKVEQLRQQGQPPPQDWAPIVREVALGLAPLVARAQMDFALDAAPAPVRAHEWALRELTRNLLHNAIKHSPPGGALEVGLGVAGGEVEFTIADHGPGLAPVVRERLFQPFAGDDPRSGSGLGLAICHDIVQSLGGRIELIDRVQDDGRIAGLTARVRLPLADNPA